MKALWISTLGALALGPLTAQCEIVKLPAPHQQPYAWFASYVDVEGNSAVVGGRTPQGANAAFLYQRSGLQWSLAQELPSPQPSGPFGSPVGLSGEAVLLGHYEQGGEAGAVYVFERAGGVWSQTQTLKANPPIADAHFGRRLAVDGRRAVIAAPMDAHQAYRGGAVFVFERIGGSWVQTARREATQPRNMGFYGLSVALEGDLLVVGEPGYQLSGGDDNRIFIYRHTPGGWVMEKRIEGVYGTGFGYAVDVDRGRIAVGAFRDVTHGGPHRGSVFLYEDQGGWVQTDYLFSTHSQGDDNFGAAIDLDGNRLAVGSGGVELLLGERVHVYRGDPGSWQLESVLAPHDDAGSWYLGQRTFGNAVAIDGEYLWVGSNADTPSGGPDTVGAAYLYTLRRLTLPYCGPANLNSTGQPAVLDVQGCATVAQNDLVLRASQLPPHQPGLFLVARQVDFVPSFGGGQGTLCLGGPLGRFSSQAGSSGPLGELELTVDFAALPSSSGLHAASPGETWRFQCWYRDTNPTPTFNFTDAVAAVVR